MTKRTKFSKTKVLTMDGFEALVESSKKKTIQGPVGYFPKAPKEHQFRLLVADHDGLGGAAFDIADNEGFHAAYINSVEAGNFLWAVVRGRLIQFETMGSMNRETMPDAFFQTSKILGFYEKPPHEFPNAGIEP